MINILDIIEGNINNFFNLNSDISANRLSICIKCPLYLNKFGGMCNSKLYLNTETNDVSIKKLDGYINGCGCILGSKTRVINAKCPCGKW